ncbi:MAG: peptide MFS transporter [Flavobacteriales bacterium]|nr:peptide MFS transporter [Flavobacteriales bacterium]MBT3964573.1 peptide MFS transporter [Flavobacteriales bacterium]MBT4704613.1 peptide MFS transporter [Flavobacteriales bacterium]MBT4930786.1 peptide MFS transporter [Flavobacteriales bacterium]MBT5132119.1 peptide MFS transporter [Flavobacteriales bacterium]
MQEQTMWGHPKGLYILFFTELWERFSFYGMRAILVLYLTAQTTGDNPGLDWTSKEALALYGWYGMFVYFMGIFGGAIADKWLGQKQSVLVGGVLIILGQFSISIDSLMTFYSGLILLVCGVGLLKPNISTMVGGLYKKGDIRRDAGFTIFYIGINIGALAAPLLVGYIGETYDWHLGFSLAGIGMILGQIVYVFGRKHLQGIGDLLKHSATEAHLATKPLSKVEKDRLIVLLLSFLIVIVFWAAYEQAGGLMNLYARDSVDRLLFGWEIPTSWFQSLHAFYVVLIGGPMAVIWLRWSKKGKESSAVFKMAVGMIIMAVSFLALMGAVYDASLSAIGKAPIYWLLLSYFLHVVAELSISPVALSFITKLAPAKYASLTMGAYFAIVGIGNKAAGLLGEAAQESGVMTVFAIIATMCFIVGLLVFALVKKLKTLTHGAEDEILESPHDEEAQSIAE